MEWGGIFVHGVWGRGIFVHGVGRDICTWSMGGGNSLLKRSKGLNCQVRFALVSRSKGKGGKIYTREGSKNMVGRGGGVQRPKVHKMN